ncbi:outer membrane beta-barrel family protein [Soonwooa sp.]|uniref:outer membrane beta-barrel family protein n=1 Tax=Soonwooa sp. TaxID=1938592 RepID=UPI002604AE91|nr:outer membrane beta-barrel family protein [Soonwooa sp.]
MRKQFLFGYFFIASFYYAQSIEGQITNANKKSISDAEVTLTQGKNKSYFITDSEGKFKINTKENGEFQLEVFQDGTSVYSEKVNIMGDIIKNITIAEAKSTETKIDGVQIVAKKKLIERKVDRMVFNVENSVAAQGLDAFEALGKTPMLRTTDKAISIAGKSNVAVMVNDKIINLSGDDLINYLKTLRSDDIAKIEIITTPPAKYEAEGRSGLINIILKKNTSLGWNASLQSSGTYYFGKPTVSHTNGVTFNYQGKKLSISSSLSEGEFYWNQKSYTHNLNNNNDGFWNTDSQWFNNFKNKGGNIKAEYKLNDKNTIGFNYNYSHNKNSEKAKNSTKILDENGARSFLSDGDNLNIRNIHNANAFYDIKIDSAGGKLSFSGNLMMNNANANNYYNTIETSGTASTFANPILKYKIYSGQADLEKTISKVKLETGVKYTKIENNSNFNFFDIQNGEFVPNLDRSNVFNYNEENYAAYASGSFKINEKWDAKAGLRYEYTKLNGFSVTDNVTNENQYGKFFPTAYISYKPSDDHTFSANYSRRISRPYFNNLNPFKYYNSEFEFNTGNPYLRPIFTDSFELAYVLKSNFSATAFYNYNKDSYDRIQFIDNGIKHNTVLNFYNESQAGINLSYNFNKFKWLESSIFVNGFYSKSKSFIPDAIAELSGYGASYSLDNSFFLNKDKTFTFLFGFWGDLPNKVGNTSFQGKFSAYSGFKLSLMDKKLLINATLDDVFNTERSKGVEYYQNFNSAYYYKGISRSFNLSLTYKFGNNNVKGATKEVKFEEKSRAGG